MTRCKYCRAVFYHAYGDRCVAVDHCRDRMLDRERRVVRVFWRVYFDVHESRRNGCECGESFCVSCCCASQDYVTRKEARELGIGWAQTKCIPTRLVRVTVRRKVKA